MEIKIIHDLSPQQLEAEFASGIDGFFFASFWYLARGKGYGFVREIVNKGGLKKAYEIPSKVIYIHGADRPLEPTAKDKRTFLRSPLFALKEAVCMMPDVIQIMDLPLEDSDDEKKICEKLAINRDIAVEYERFLIKNNFRSSSRYSNGVAKNSVFMLLGVCHGDYPEAYAEEAKFMMDKAEVIGIPMAGLLTKIKGMSKAERYNYAKQVFTKVLDVVGESRIIQLMGFGMSNLTEIVNVLKAASKFDGCEIWVESSTIIRNSTHARKLLSRSLKNSNRVEYVNTARVKGAEKYSLKDIFRENDKILKGILRESSQFNG